MARFILDRVSRRLKDLNSGFACSRRAEMPMNESGDSSLGRSSSSVMDFQFKVISDNMKTMHELFTDFYDLYLIFQRHIEEANLKASETQNELSSSTSDTCGPCSDGILTQSSALPLPLLDELAEESEAGDIWSTPRDDTSRFPSDFEPKDYDDYNTRKADSKVASSSTSLDVVTSQQDDCIPEVEQPVHLPESQTTTTISSEVAELRPPDETASANAPSALDSQEASGSEPQPHAGVVQMAIDAREEEASGSQPQLDENIVQTSINDPEEAPVSEIATTTSGSLEQQHQNFQKVIKNMTSYVRLLPMRLGVNAEVAATMKSIPLVDLEECVPSNTTTEDIEDHHPAQTLLSALGLRSKCNVANKDGSDTPTDTEPTALLKLSSLPPLSRKRGRKRKLSPLADEKMATSRETSSEETSPKVQEEKMATSNESSTAVQKEIVPEEVPPRKRGRKKKVPASDDRHKEENLTASPGMSLRKRKQPAGLKDSNEINSKGKTAGGKRQSSPLDPGRQAMPPPGIPPLRSSDPSALVPMEDDEICADVLSTVYDSCDDDEDRVTVVDNTMDDATYDDYCSSNDDDDYQERCVAWEHRYSKLLCNHYHAHATFEDSSANRFHRDAACSRNVPFRRAPWPINVSRDNDRRSMYDWRKPKWIPIGVQEVEVTTSDWEKPLRVKKNSNVAISSGNETVKKSTPDASQHNHGTLKSILKSPPKSVSKSHSKSTSKSVSTSTSKSVSTSSPRSPSKSVTKSGEKRGRKKKLTSVVTSPIAPRMRTLCLRLYNLHSMFSMWTIMRDFVRNKKAVLLKIMVERTARDLLMVLCKVCNLNFKVSDGQIIVVKNNTPPPITAAHLELAVKEMERGMLRQPRELLFD